MDGELTLFCLSYPLTNSYAELCRAGGSSSTFDLVLHLKGGELVEFSQIDRSELGRLQSYIAQCKIKVGTLVWRAGSWALHCMSVIGLPTSCAGN